MAESVTQLQKLYAHSSDAKVRADLIALLLRQGKAEEILAVCPDCRMEDYSADELENIAKAARDVGSYRVSADYYRQLQEKVPNYKVGYLGGVPASVDVAITRLPSILSMLTASVFWARPIVVGVCESRRFVVHRQIYL